MIEVPKPGIFLYSVTSIGNANNILPDDLQNYIGTKHVTLGILTSFDHSKSMLFLEVLKIRYQQ